MKTTAGNVACGTAATMRSQVSGWTWARSAARLADPPASTAVGCVSRLVGVPGWRSRAAMTQVMSMQAAVVHDIGRCWAAVSRM